MEGIFSKKILSGFIFAVLVFQSLSVQALSVQSRPTQQRQADISHHYTRAGIQYFNQGQYLKARTSLEQALSTLSSADKSRTAIYYNLGSVCYRLKEYKQSRVYFNKLVGDKRLGAIAYYNLALIENRLGNKPAAIAYLQKSRRITTDRQLIVLANRQLHQLDNKIDTGQPHYRYSRTVRKDWHAYFYLSPGYDSNINFAPLDIGSGRSGRFIQGIGLFDKKIAGKGSGYKTPVLLFTSSIFLSNYISTDFNDYNLFNIGLRYKLPLKQWHNVLDVNIKQSTYGHGKYQRNYSVTVYSRRYFSKGKMLRLRYRYDQINSLDSIYDYLQGYRQRLGAAYQIKWTHDYLFLWYELEFNQRRNTVRRNYSPTRNSFRLRYERKLDSSHKIYIETEYQRSDYVPTAVQDRLDNRSMYSLAYIYDFARSWQFKAQWRFANNRSTDSLFSYKRHVGLLTLRKSF